MTRISLALPAACLALGLVTGCSSPRQAGFAYDESVPPLPSPPITAADDSPRLLHIPPPWTPARGGEAASTPAAQVIAANAAARVEPRREGYYNALQVFPWSEGALYQIHAAPGQITSIALEPGERLTGPGPIAAGDTARWIIGDTTSGAGRTARVHILVKPTRPDITTNLVVNTDRRTYHLELRASDAVWMPAVAWAYPDSPVAARPLLPRPPAIPPEADRRYRYALSGANPPWRPVSAFDDGRRVYIVFPPGIAQGEMPPLFVIGPDGGSEIANTRVRGNVLIVDRLFAAAELRLGAGQQEVVWVARTDGRQPAPRHAPAAEEQGR